MSFFIYTPLPANKSQSLLKNCFRPLTFMSHEAPPINFCVWCEVEIKLLPPPRILILFSFHEDVFLLKADSPGQLFGSFRVSVHLSGRVS